MYIFISYNHNDKDIVEPILSVLVKSYGKENIFFDSWAILPGDGIIEKMNEGLTKCDVFFFFVSFNSLKSEMVKLEWQNALMKKSTKKIKFVPIKLDNCDMPAILMQTCYIDLNKVGFDFGCRQMIDVINETNSYQIKKEYCNLFCKIEKEENRSIVLTFFVKNYFEPDARFLIFVDCDTNVLKVTCLSDSMRITNKLNNIRLSDGEIYNALFEMTTRGISIGFPYKIRISSKNNIPFDILGIVQEYKKDCFKLVEICE